MNQTCTKYFEVEGTGNQKIHDELAKQRRGGARIFLDGFFNKSMRFVECTLYGVKKTGGNSNQLINATQFYLKFHSNHGELCLDVNIKDGEVGKLPKKQITALPGNLEVIGTYGSP